MRGQQPQGMIPNNMGMMPGSNPMDLLQMQQMQQMQQMFQNMTPKWWLDVNRTLFIIKLSILLLFMNNFIKIIQLCKYINAISITGIQIYNLKQYNFLKIQLTYL